MIITYHGIQNFKIQFGDTILAFDPISKESAEKPVKFGSDVTLISLNHPDTNGAEQTALGSKTPFVIDGPGEYEVKEVFVKGYPSESRFGGSKRPNTIYTVALENMNIVFLGALGTKDLEPKTLEAIGNTDIDILFTPIGGDGVLGPAEAYNFALKLEPKMIIPMNFGSDGKSALQTFLKEGGAQSARPADKLTVKRKDLEGKSGEIIMLAEQ